MRWRFSSLRPCLCCVTGSLFLSVPQTAGRGCRHHHVGPFIHRHIDHATGEGHGGGGSSLRPNPVTGTSTVSPSLMTPCSDNFSSPAKAAAEVGSAKMPSSAARSLCICRMPDSSTATADPPVSRSISRICHWRDGAAMDIPPATVLRTEPEFHTSPLKAATKGMTLLDWTQCRRGNYSIRPESRCSLKPLNAPIRREPLPTGKTTCSGIASPNCRTTS